MTNQHPLRRRRVELGLTQGELARAAGVSRQLVAAVEAGVNTPAVDAGLRLARVLDCPVEQLFDDAASAREPKPAAGLPWASRGALVVAGCDPVLGVAESALGDRARGSLLVAVEATSGGALRSLAERRIHAAVVHGREGNLPRPPLDVVRVQVAHWQVGIGLAAAAGARSLQACLDAGIPIVQRHVTAASQTALLRAVATLGQRLAPAPLASGHRDAARLAATLGCAAITTEGAARHARLRFDPLELHTVELWLDRDWEAHPSFVALVDLLQTPQFTERARRLGGYDMTGCGSLLPPVLAR